MAIFSQRRTHGYPVCRRFWPQPMRQSQWLLRRKAGIHDRD
jgi:hypothetical protein